MVRFRFVGLSIALLAGCTYFTEVSRYDVCERCDASAADQDKPDASPDADAADDAVDRDSPECANGRDC